MLQVIKWLKEHNIEFTLYENRHRAREKEVVITLEKDCVWINGYNEPMKYDKNICVKHFNRGEYLVIETTGYSMSHTLCVTTKKERVIQVLEERLGI